MDEDGQRTAPPARPKRLVQPVKRLSDEQEAPKHVAPLAERVASGQRAREEQAAAARPLLQTLHREDLPAVSSGWVEVWLA